MPLPASTGAASTARPGRLPSRRMAARRSRRHGCRAGAIRSRRTSGWSAARRRRARSPSRTTSAMSGRPNAIPSRTSSSRRRVSWLWPPVAARTRVTVRPEDRDERVGVARAAWREPGELAEERVVDVDRGERQVDRDRRRAGPAAPTPRRGRGSGRGTRPSASVGSSKPAAPAWPPKRMKRSAQRSRVAPRSSDPSLRHEARTTSPSSAPTTAGRPRSSASRAATSPTIPTLHGPRTTVAALDRLRRRRPRAPRRRPSSSGRGGSGWRPRAHRRGSPASAGSSASRSRAASSASPTRPAALSRGAMANETVSRSTAAGAIRARSSSAAIPGRGARRSRSRPEPRDRPVLADDRRDVGDRSRSSRGPRGRAPPPARPARRRAGAARP